jgi:2-(1,2-epoxy-1,2-dihydrophenyl)acetyl-CoA isomerase
MNELHPKAITDQPVLFSTEEGVATITLNRPDALNAMTDSLMRGISDAFARVADDPDVRVVIVTGAGRGFCAGADLSAVGNAPASPGPFTGAQENPFNDAMRALKECPVPTLARVHGPAAGGGFGLAMACDITIAAKSAFFVATFGPKLGIVPDLGTTWSLPTRAGRARALGIALLGDRLSPEQAEEWGLIWRAVDDDQLDAEVARVAAILKRSSPNASTRIRKAIDAALHNTFSDQLDLEMEHQAVLIPKNMIEGAQAFMEKRDPTFDGDREK